MELEALPIVECRTPRWLSSASDDGGPWRGAGEDFGGGWSFSRCETHPTMAVGNCNSRRSRTRQVSPEEYYRKRSREEHKLGPEKLLLPSWNSHSGCERNLNSRDRERSEGVRRRERNYSSRSPEMEARLVVGKMERRLLGFCKVATCFLGEEPSVVGFNFIRPTPCKF